MIDDPDDDVRRALDERARVLARPLAAPPPRGEMLEVLTFVLDRDRYGVETRHIREVVRFVDYTPVPGVPDFVVGVTNLHGEVVAAIDLRPLLGLPRRTLGDLARLVVLGGARAEFGVLADATEGVLALSAASLRPPSEAGASGGGGLVRGVTAGALAVLDGAALLADPRLYVGQDQGPGLGE